MDDPSVPEEMQSGPFGIGKDFEWDWDYYVKSGESPTDEQFQLANMLGMLARRIRSMGRNDRTEELNAEARDLFSGALVNHVLGDLTNYKTVASDIESRFHNEYLTGAIQKKLTKPILFVSAFSVLFIVAAIFFEEISTKVPRIPPETLSLFWMLSGTLAGRVIYYGSTYVEVMKDINHYNSIVRQISRVYIGLIFDVFLSGVAFALFASGFLIITIGATEGQPGSGISSLSVTTSALIAFAFGMIIGFARTEFLKKLREVTSGSVT